MNTLILVESPLKARAVGKYARGLFDGPVLARSTGGHLRDLPKGRLGVDVENDFAPQYEIRSRQIVSALRPLIRQAGRVILATDPDREGEAIAWHIVKIFEKELEGKEVLRAVFRAVTREAVREGLIRPRPLDCALIQAAVARRAVDRLIGYQVSPRLWAEMGGRDHGVGRVQAAALRMLQANADQWEVKIE